MDQNTNAPVKKANWVGIVSFICSLVGFVFSPLWIVNGVAIGFGIGGIANKKCEKKVFAIIGLILGIVGLIAQATFDFIITLCTMGFGVVFFFI